MGVKHKVERKYWNEIEDEYLKLNWKKLDDYELSLQLNCHISQVKARRLHLNLKREQNKIHNVFSNGFKICKTCGENLQEEDYRIARKRKDGSVRFRPYCKVCTWFKENDDKYFKNNDWTHDEDIELLRSSLKSQFESINELSKYLNKDLDEVCDRIKELNLQGIRKVIVNCAECNKQELVSMYNYQNSYTTCSKECQGKWYSKNLTGENNPNFNSVKMNCHWCGKPYYVKQYKVDNQDNFFCSKKCRQEWFAKDYSQTDENRNFHRIKAVKILEDGLISKTDSEVQLIVNKVLDDLNIDYINEKGFKYHSIDNYLPEYNLAIEVMGGYWHCDYRKYPIIKYERQVDRIKQDKAKHTYLKEIYDIEILYLWEDDIFDNLEMCIELVKQYIDRNISNSYHSSYYMADNPNKQYMQRNIDDVKKLYSPQVIDKICKKQYDKWITYECEYCGKEKEQLISHYNNNKTHTCSLECMGKLNSLKEWQSCKL